MTAVPTLHVRNVPANVYEDLRARAEGEGRSINATVIDILRESTDRKRRHAENMRRLLAMGEGLPPGTGDALIEIIREGRDAGYSGL